MFSQPRLGRGTCLLALGLVTTGSLVAAEADGPCDILKSGGAPCIAAHSTTRSLYGNTQDALYQVRRGSDGATKDITPLSAGGVADAAAQDSFCADTTCLITIIYDQSGHGNHLTQAPHGRFRGPEAKGSDSLASATGAPVTLNGQKAYGVFISPGTGYRNNNATNTPTGDDPQGIYAVVDGTHHNDGCCFDYGNAETSGNDTGNGHMEALYYGSCTVWGTGAGNGPWLMADLENGLFSGQSAGKNTANPSISDRFFTGAIKGRKGEWAIRGANAASDSLSTYYSGPRPSRYGTMKKEGAILLGIGGDNSANGQGTFYEGVMTSAYPSEATEDAVQANIAAARYATTSLTSGPALTVGTTVSLRVTTPGFDDRYLSHTDMVVNTQVVSASSSTALKQQASWTVRPGLGNSACFSFESVDMEQSFLRHYGFVLRLEVDNGSKQLREDATFCPQEGLNGKDSSIRAWGYPTRYIRHQDNRGFVAANGSVMNFDSPRSYNDDVSWVLQPGLA